MFLNGWMQKQIVVHVAAEKPLRSEKDCTLHMRICTVSGVLMRKEHNHLERLHNVQFHFWNVIWMTRL